mmetsp:Transcript_16167/g.46572  ORF Transcript_16167/g.46572 Transcript_16167/m.46572 type:complete len:213 (+) Transcript_16167:84-722(+)
MIGGMTRGEKRSTRTRGSVASQRRRKRAVWVQYEAGGGSRATRSRVAAADCSSASLISHCPQSAMSLPEPSSRARSGRSSSEMEVSRSRCGTGERATASASAGESTGQASKYSRGLGARRTRCLRATGSATRCLRRERARLLSAEVRRGGRGSCLLSYLLSPTDATLFVRLPPLCRPRPSESPHHRGVHDRVERHRQLRREPRQAVAAAVHV